MTLVPLWRLCRVLANRARLRMLLLLSQQRSLRVGEVARVMKMSRPAASQYLRALEGCGFLRARRIRRAVIYELPCDKKQVSNETLRETLMDRLAAREKSIEPIFKLATAFANAGRIEVFRALKTRPKSLLELKSEIDSSRWTLWRHLHKLEKRGFVHHRKGEGTYAWAKVADPFGRALADAAANASVQP